MLPHITILATGGTIAGTGISAVNTVCHDAGVLGVDQLLAAVPTLKSIAKIQAEQLANIDSKDMTTGLWIELAQRVNALLYSNTVDGIVITHGTDTLEETAFFLHLTVKSVKPVVITAAMRPATALAADGPLNLYQAVMVAGSKKSSGQGVLVVMNDEIHSARYVTKTDTAAVQAFRSPIMGKLGWIQDGDVQYLHSVTRMHTIQSRFNIFSLPSSTMPWVEIVLSYTEPSAFVIQTLVNMGVKGIVIAGTGNGSIHTILQQAAAEAVQRGVAVVRSSRVPSGHVMYNGAVNDDELGFIASDCLHPWKARVLLMLILAEGITSHAERQAIFNNY